MSSLIPKPHVATSDSSHLLSLFLRVNSKITFKHDGQFHKGYLTKSPDGTYCFSYKSHVNKKHPDWSASLPNLTPTWHKLCSEGTLYPGHLISIFLWDNLQTSSALSASSGTAPDCYSTPLLPRTQTAKGGPKVSTKRERRHSITGHL